MVEMAEIIAVCLAGLLALLGLFTGAFLERKAQHKKWQMEMRSKAYAKFLILMHEARQEASDVVHDKSIEEPQKGIKSHKIYSKMLNYRYVVCLYLPESKRKEFKDLVEKAFVLYTEPDLEVSRLKLVDEKEDKIQCIFEETLWQVVS